MTRKVRTYLATLTLPDWTVRHRWAILGTFAVLLAVGLVLMFGGENKNTPLTTRIAFANADAEAMAKGIFGGMEPKLREMAQAIETVSAENAKTNVEVESVKGRVAKIENAPAMTPEDLQREIKKLMDTIELRLKQLVPMSQYEEDKKAAAAKISALERITNAFSIVANAQTEPPARVVRTVPVARPIQPTAPAVAPAKPAEIDHTRFDELVQENPRAMAGTEEHRDKWALYYNALTPEQFEQARQKIRIREAGLDRPKSTERDLANYEKERRAAVAHVPRCKSGTFSKEKGKCI